MYAVYACLTEQHQPWLVVLAVLICLFASITAFNLMHRALVSAGKMRWAWLVTTAIATGSGIWSTHFVAMLAFEPGMPVGYDFGLTALSAMIAITITGSGFALALTAGSRARVGLGGGIVGAGISAMHYTGMAALRVPAVIGWDTALVSASIVFGIGFAAVALLTALRDRELQPRLMGALLLTVAICTMHFTAMGALRLTPTPLVPLPGDQALQPDWLAVGVAATALVLLAFSLTGAMVDQHLARRSEREAERLRGLVNATFEGIAIHADGRLLDANAALARVLGREIEQILGLPVLDLVAPESRDLVRAQIESGSEELYEAELLRPDGSRVSVEILARRIDYRGRPVRVAAIRDTSERKRAEQRIWHMAHHDPLTGLPNRGLFHDRLEHALTAARRRDEQVAVLCLDLDRFKDVNDLRGHAAGDELLCQIADRLTDSLRETDTVARLGGDEFAIVQPGIRHLEEVAAFASRLVGTLAEPMELDGQKIGTGLSIGIALYPSDGDTADTLLVNADTALYRAKTDGRGTFRLFEPEMDAKLRQRRALEYDLRQAVVLEQIDVHYQPQADSGSGTIVGFEALVRWQHPERGDIPPSEFIPLAEESGLILSLGEWVLRTACAEAACWAEHLRISVNLSPAQLRRGDLPALVADILRETGLDAARLELEITEGVLVRDTEQALEVLRRLKQLGVHIAMDDFGTGYSSLSYLQRFPFDRIKIDKSFIHALQGSNDAAAIVRAVIGLGRSLRLPVVAEGVETAAQLEMLQGEQCDEIQGFLIGRPLPIAAYWNIIRPAAPREQLEALSPLSAKTA